MEGTSPEDTPQPDIHADETYRDGPESASPRASTPVSSDVPRSRQSDYLPAETVPRQRAQGSDVPYSRPESLGVNARPYSQTASHRHGSDSERLQPMQAAQQDLNLQAPSHENVLTLQFPDAAALPLKDRTEAILFRHYIQKIAVCVSSPFDGGSIALDFSYPLTVATARLL